MDFAGAGHPLNSDGVTAAAEHVGVDPAVLWSVVLVEPSGCGFLPDRRSTILFERHIFSTRTHRRFDATHPGISGPAGATVRRGRSNTGGWRRQSPATRARRSRALPRGSAKSWVQRPLGRV